MLRRFTLIHLLLGVIFINILMIALFVLALSGVGGLATAWFAKLIGLGTGPQSNYLFLSLLVFVNGAAILGASYLILVPVLSEGQIGSYQALHDTLKRSPHVSDEACGEVLRSLHHDREAMESNRINAMIVFLVGMLLFALIFPALCYNFAHTFEAGIPLFVRNGMPVANADITIDDAVMFGLDQAARAATLFLLDVFGWRIGALSHNLGNFPFTVFVFAFRFALLVSFLTLLASAMKRISQQMFWRGYTSPQGKGEAERAEAEEAAEPA
ncbi:MAG: hypothetical protein HXY22_02495 [Alphaproteobacteria bacterium]|nr:hypothetical protein [Alphaproteobacteria bacterium]